MDNKTENFRGGEVVVLKSGGPKMTVASVDSHNNIVYCTWFHNGQFEVENFYTCCLVRVP